MCAPIQHMLPWAQPSAQPKRHHDRFSRFWATVCKTVRPMLTDRCLSALSVCDVGVLWSNGWRDQDETWHAGSPRPWPHCVRWRLETQLLSPKGAQPPIIGPCLLSPNSCMEQDATWYGGRPRPRRHCVRWVPSSPSPKRGQSPLANFRPMSIVVQRLDGSRWHLAWDGPWSRPHCARWVPSSPPQKGAELPEFSPISIVAKRLHASRCHLVWR